MVDWYAKVLGMVINHQSSTPMGSHTPSGLRATWVTNDKANHRIGLIALPGLTDDHLRPAIHRVTRVGMPELQESRPPPLHTGAKAVLSEVRVGAVKAAPPH